jgi:hypothetical protein
MIRAASRRRAGVTRRCYGVHQGWTGGLTGRPEVRREGQETCSDPDTVRSISEGVRMRTRMSPRPRSLSRSPTGGSESTW